MTRHINDKVCPFCKAANHCLAAAGNTCWCNKVSIPAQLLDLLPIELQRKSCICITCINLFNENRSLFKAKFISLKAR